MALALVECLWSERAMSSRLVLKSSLEAWLLVYQKIDTEENKVVQVYIYPRQVVG